LVGDPTSSLPLFALALSTRLVWIALASDGRRRPTTTSMELPDAARATGAGRTTAAAARRTRPRVRPAMLAGASNRAGYNAPRADVAELVDAHGSGPCGLRPVEVQVLSSA